MPDKDETKTGLNMDAPAETLPATDPEMAEAPLFDGPMIDGIEDDLVTDWKKKYGKLFVIWHIQTPYVYRSFGFHEYKDFQKEVMAEVQTQNPPPERIAAVTDEVFRNTALKKFVLWPPNFKDLMEKPEARLPSGEILPAGLPYILGDYILASSGFMNTEPQIIQ